MGGGDLNMKKSWHPQRLDNVEKVWQREEAQKAERRRMEELRREIQEEKNMEDIRKRGEEMGVLKKQKDRLDWMYKGPGNSVNREDYMLGKEIDKAVMDAPAAEAAGDSSSSAPAQSLTVDIATKVREDPLFAIKKREISGRKELLNNPIRMKQLQQLLKKEVNKKDKKKRKKEKKEKKKLKKKKHHRKSKHESSDSESESSSEEEQSHKKMRRRRDSESPPKTSRHNYHQNRKRYRQHGHGLIGGSHRMNRDSSEERQTKAYKHHDKSKHAGKYEQEGRRRQISPEVQRHKDKYRDTGRGNRHHSRSRSPQKRQRRSRSSSPKQREASSSPSPLQHRRHTRDLPKHRRSRSKSPRQQRRKSRSPVGRLHSRSPDYHRRRSRSTSPRQQRRRSRSVSPRQHRRSRSTSPRQQRRRSTSVSPRQQRRKSRSPHPPRRSRSRSPKYQRRRSRSVSPKQDTRYRSQLKKKMDEDEMARKRAEMMENAKWRDDQRKERVQQYEAEENAEVEEERKKSKNAKFLKTMKLPANSSVEDRIRSNIHNIQRTKAALDKNFARK